MSACHIKHLEAIKLRSEDFWCHLVELEQNQVKPGDHGHEMQLLWQKRERHAAFVAVFFLKYIMELDTTFLSKFKKKIALKRIYY